MPLGHHSAEHQAIQPQKLSDGVGSTCSSSPRAADYGGCPTDLPASRRHGAWRYPDVSLADAEVDEMKQGDF